MHSSEKNEAYLSFVYPMFTLNQGSFLEKEACNQVISTSVVDKKYYISDRCYIQVKKIR